MPHPISDEKEDILCFRLFCRVAARSQHDLSEATARALASADARIDALEAGIREIYRDSEEWWYEAEPLYEALEEAWSAFS